MVSREDGQKVMAFRLKSKTAKTHQDLRAALGFPHEPSKPLPDHKHYKNMFNIPYKAMFVVGVIQIAA
jgi:hypothetical protein